MFLGVVLKVTILGGCWWPLPEELETSYTEKLTNFSSVKVVYYLTNHGAELYSRPPAVVLYAPRAACLTHSMHVEHILQPSPVR
jgi:hypothetical protein